jgi:hypothetical protein
MDGGNIMVLKYITKGGTRIHGPPYTKAEEAEFYRRQGRGPVTVVRPLMTVKSRSPEHRGSTSRCGNFISHICPQLPVATN